MSYPIVSKAQISFVVTIVALTLMLLGSAVIFAEPLETPPAQDTDLQAVPEADYSKADYAARVLEIQFDLRKLGYYEGEFNGELNTKTRDAIRTYQLDQMLEIDGNLSEALRRSLGQKMGRLN